MEERDSFRGTSIDEKFCKEFKKTKFYSEIYLKHLNEIFIGIRDGYINLYYNCDSIAKINVSSPHKASIAPYYTDGGKKTLSDDEFVSLFQTIKEKSNLRDKKEKQAQEKLVIDNNNNPQSKWFCIDVEYTKSLKGKNTAENWRFDIIAITKSRPHKVALIELKYGKGAMKEPSGIRTHVEDFYSFFINNKFESIKGEIVNIINKLYDIGVCVPHSLCGLSPNDILTDPEFYFITLNNNPENGVGSTPEQTMSGYLFNDNRWNCRRVSVLAKGKDYFEITENNDQFKPVFLFSEATLPNIGIYDILDERYYTKKIVD